MTQLHLLSKTNINKHENDNWFSKHFRQKLPSQYSRNIPISLTDWRLDSLSASDPFMSYSSCSLVLVS